MKYWYVSTGLHIAISWSSICPSTAMRTLNLILVIQHPNNTLQNNKSIPYTVFSSMPVPSSQVALLFSEHCPAISLSLFFPQHERPLQNTRYNHSFVYLNSLVS